MIYVNVCVCVCVHICTPVWRYPKGPEQYVNNLKMELEVVVSSLMWALKTELGSSGRTQVLIITEPYLPPPKKKTFDLLCTFICVCGYTCMYSCLYPPCHLAHLAIHHFYRINEYNSIQLTL